jgi:hypothetical protein
MGGQLRSLDWADPVPEWSMFRAADYGYTRIYVHSAEMLQMQYIGDRDGGIHDDFTIHKSKV